MKNSQNPTLAETKAFYPFNAFLGTDYRSI